MTPVPTCGIPPSAQPKGSAFAARNPFPGAPPFLAETSSLILERPIGIESLSALPGLVALLLEGLATFPHGVFCGWREHQARANPEEATTESEQRDPKRQQDDGDAKQKGDQAKKARDQPHKTGT
jgi:hypothetical protein